MGVKFRPRAAKLTGASAAPTEQIEKLQAEVERLKEANAANEQLLDTLLGVSDDGE